MGKKVFKFIWVTIVLCIVPPVLCIFFGRLHYFARFQGPAAVKEYISSELTIGKSTVNEAHDFMTARIYNSIFGSDGSCDTYDSNTKMTCWIEYDSSIPVCIDLYRFMYTFADGVLSNVKVELASRCL